MDCSLSRKHVDSYVDGELSTGAVLEFESHVGRCPECEVHVAFARRLKCSVQEHFGGTRAPVSLRAGVAGLLAKERRVESGGGAGVRSRLPGSVGVVAAAGLLLIFATVQGGGPNDVTGARHAGLSLSVFGDIVKRHRDRAPTEIETQEPAQAARWVGDNMGMRIDTIAFGEARVRLLGARLSHVGASRAAKLYYSVGEHRLTAVVFESTAELRRILEQEPRIQHERIGDRDVTFYSVHGYTVPVIEHAGLIYGFTGDLDQQRLLRLIASAHWP